MEKRVLANRNDLVDIEDFMQRLETPPSAKHFMERASAREEERYVKNRLPRRR